MQIYFRVLMDVFKRLAPGCYHAAVCPFACMLEATPAPSISRIFARPYGAVCGGFACRDGVPPGPGSVPFLQARFLLQCSRRALFKAAPPWRLILLILLGFWRASNPLYINGLQKVMHTVTPHIAHRYPLNCTPLPPLICLFALPRLSLCSYFYMLLLCR